MSRNSNTSIKPSSVNVRGRLTSNVSSNPERSSKAVKGFDDRLRERLNELLPKSDNIDVQKVIDVYKELPHVNPEMEIRDDNLLLTVVFLSLSGVQYSKEGTYGDSWRKRGELEVFFNLARKFDRLENIVLNGSKDEVGEPYVDTVGDSANYGLLWMTLILRQDPDLFLSWVESNKNS